MREEKNLKQDDCVVTDDDFETLNPEAIEDIGETLNLYADIFKTATALAVQNEVDDILYTLTVQFRKTVQGCSSRRREIEFRHQMLVHDFDFIRGLIDTHTILAQKEILFAHMGDLIAPMDLQRAKKHREDIYNAATLFVHTMIEDLPRRTPSKTRLKFDHRYLQESLIQLKTPDIVSDIKNLPRNHFLDWMETIQQHTMIAFSGMMSAKLRSVCTEMGYLTYTHGLKDKPVLKVPQDTILTNRNDFMHAKLPQQMASLHALYEARQQFASETPTGALPQIYTM